MVQALRQQKPIGRQNNSTSSLPTYIAIARDGEATRVYEVAPGDNLDEVCQWDRALTDGSVVDSPHSSYEHCSLEEVRDWIRRTQGTIIEALRTENDYPEQPLMGRSANATAYAVLDRELIVQTNRDLYLERPGIRRWNGEPSLPPYGISYNKSTSDRHQWNPEQWVVFVDIAHSLSSTRH